MASPRIFETNPALAWGFYGHRLNLYRQTELDWQDRRSRRQESYLRSWLDAVRRLVVDELDAGTAIPSVRHFSHSLVVQQGARLVRINPCEPVVPTPRDVSIPGAALESLMAIEAALAK